jgi:hypothetical protein
MIQVTAYSFESMKFCEAIFDGALSYTLRNALSNPLNCLCGGVIACTERIRYGGRPVIL